MSELRCHPWEAERLASREAPGVFPDTGRPDTNTISVTLPRGMSLNNASSAIRRFGDIASLSMQPGVEIVVTVTFYDVRAVRKALRTLGDRCIPRPMSGDRTVRMPGGAKLDSKDLKGVVTVKADLTETGAFVVTFFDTRDAERARQSLRGLQSASPAAPQQASSSPSLTAPSAPQQEPVETAQRAEPLCVVAAQEAEAASAAENSAASAPEEHPCAEHPCAESSSREAVAAAAAVAAAGLLEGGHLIPICTRPPTQHTTAAGMRSPRGVKVLLHGLPNAICSPPCMEAVLEQASLLWGILCFDVWAGDPCGQALLTVQYDAVDQCMRHFYGRQWDANGFPVSVYVLSQQGSGACRSSRGHGAKASRAERQRAKAGMAGDHAARPCSPVKEDPTEGSSEAHSPEPPCSDRCSVELVGSAVGSESAEDEEDSSRPRRCSRGLPSIKIEELHRGSEAPTEDSTEAGVSEEEDAEEALLVVSAASSVRSSSDARVCEARVVGGTKFLDATASRISEVGAH